MTWTLEQKRAADRAYHRRKKITKFGIELGNTDLRGKFRVTPLATRFWAKVQKGSDDQCWLWTGFRKRPSGYGMIGQGGKHGPVLRASRVSWEIHFGPIPEGMEVLHRCDNPPCVNPHHLWLGTQADNMHDMAAKGRGRK